MIEIRRGERARALLAFSILFLVLAAYTAVKAVRDAIFLSRFGVREISYVAMGLAVVSGLVVTVFLRATRGLPRHVLITLTHVVVAGTLVGLHWAMGGGGASWAPWALYIWSSLFGVFIVMQFWLLAAELFDVREAKRLFGLVGAGAILGALAGGVVAQVVAVRWSARALLLVAAAMLVGAAVLGHVVWPLRPEEEEEPAREGEVEGSSVGVFELLRTPSLLRLIAVALLLSTVTTTLIDWQVKAIAKHAFASDADAMARFFGALFTWQSVAALGVQVFVTGWLLRRAGLAVGRLVLPVAVAAGSVAILLHPALAITIVTAAGFAKVAEGGLRFAVDKATVELTWLPVPTATRRSTKSFIDTVFDRLGTGVTGVLWLGLAAVGLDQPGRVHWMSVVVLGLVLVWVAVLRATHVRYVDSFRKSLAARAIDLDSLRAALGEEEAARTLGSAIAHPDPDQALFGLYLLGEGTLPDLTPALEHASPAVRTRALELLSSRRASGYEEAARGLLDDTDDDVREAAIVYLRRCGLESVERASVEVLPEDLPFSEAVVALGAPEQAAAAVRHIEARLQGEGADRLGDIQLLGAAPPEAAALLLSPLIDHEDDAIRAAAIRAAGRAGAVKLVPRLAERLGDRHWRAAATSALSDMGPEATMALVRELDDAHISLAAKRAIIRLAGASAHAPVAASIEPLLEAERSIAWPAARALSRLRFSLGEAVVVSPLIVEQRIAHAGRQLLGHLCFLGRGSWPAARTPTAEEPFLERTVREACEGLVRHIFALLSLIHTPSDIRSALRGIRSPLRSVRARSLEFLDNLLAPNTRALLLVALEDRNAQQLGTAASPARRGGGHE